MDGRALRVHTPMSQVTVTPIDNKIDDAVGLFTVSHLVVSQVGVPLFSAVSLSVSITNDDVGALAPCPPPAQRLVCCRPSSCLLSHVPW